jgi:hypothetical protein
MDGAGLTAGGEPCGRSLAQTALLHVVRQHEVLSRCWRPVLKPPASRAVSQMEFCHDEITQSTLPALDPSILAWTWSWTCREALSAGAVFVNLGEHHKPRSVVNGSAARH